MKCQQNLELPLQIRSHDPNLRFSPHYKLKNGNFILQIGPKVFSLVNIGEYCGWEIFREKGYTTIDKLSELGVVTKITRIALRYINLFADLNVYEHSNLRVLLTDNSLDKNKTNLAIEIPTGDYVSLLKMINGAEVLIEKKTVKGSIVDIDTVLASQPIPFECIKDIIESAHSEEKKIFFSLLKEDFIKSLNPIF